MCLSFPGIEEALKAVAEINAMIDSVTPSIQDKPKSYALPLTVRFESGDYAAVEYLGIILWDNNDNNIPWAENGNEREMSLKDFLLKQMRELTSQVQAQLVLLTVDMQAWANGSCPEPGCSFANPHEQGAECVKPTDVSNNEPTEEQRLAAVNYYTQLSHAFSADSGLHIDRLARLLAEREAKLREEVAEHRSAKEDQMTTELLSGLIRAMKEADVTDDTAFKVLVNRGMTELEITALEMAAEFSTSLPTISRWKNGVNAPLVGMRRFVFEFFVERAESTESKGQKNGTPCGRVAELEGERDMWRENAGVALNAWERIAECVEVLDALVNDPDDIGEETARDLAGALLNKLKADKANQSG